MKENGYAEVLILVFNMFIVWQSCMRKTQVDTGPAIGTSSSPPQPPSSLLGQQVTVDLEIGPAGYLFD